MSSCWAASVITLRNHAEVSGSALTASSISLDTLIHSGLGANASSPKGLNFAGRILNLQAVTSVASICRIMAILLRKSPKLDNVLHHIGLILDYLVLVPKHSILQHNLRYF